MNASLDLNRTRRLTTAIAVLALHALMGAALLFALAGKDLPIVHRPDDIPLITDVPLPSPPPPPRERPRPSVHRRATASRPAAPRAPVLAPPPPPLIATPVLAPAIAPQPAGTGAGGGLGGSGAGTGAGGSGNGDGDGGGGWPPEHVGGRIKDGDYPHALTAAHISGTVSVRYRVGTDGRVGDCAISRSSGHAELDALTCSLIQRRFRFRPARDADGRPVSSIIVENHSWVLPSAGDDGPEKGNDDGGSGQ